MPSRHLLLAGCVALLALFGSGLISVSTAAADSSLRYFGYFAARITPSGGNHLAEVAYRSNLNWVQISDFDRYAPEVLDGCAPRGCIVSTGHEFFTGCDSVHDPDCGLHPDYAVRWGRLADAVRSRIGKVGAFYLMDEPQWRGASPAELATATNLIKRTFPGVPVMMVEAGPQVTPSLRVPPQVDWVGFDWYCRRFSDVERTLATLASRTAAHQSLFLVPEAAPLAACGGAPGHATDAEIAALQYDYFHLAQTNPRVIGLLAFGFWTSGYGSADLPLTVAAHERIAAQIIHRPGGGGGMEPAPPPPDLTVTFKGRHARLSRRAVARVRLSCPETNAQPCGGKLRLRRRGKLGRCSFELSPGESKRVKLRIKRSRRKAILRRAAKRRGVRVKATAKTPAGKAKAKLKLRRHSRPKGR